MYVAFYVSVFKLHEKGVGKKDAQQQKFGSFFLVTLRSALRKSLNIYYMQHSWICNFRCWGFLLKLCSKGTGDNTLCLVLNPHSEYVFALVPGLTVFEGWLARRIFKSCPLTRPFLEAKSQAKCTCETCLASLAIGNLDLLRGEIERAFGKTPPVQKLLHL